MLEHYLGELNKIQLLSREEEQALWRRYKENGDRSARQELITAYQPLVYRLVARLAVSSDILMDLIQEGIIGLIEAVENFEPERKIRFSTYATYRIRGRVLNYLKQDYDLDLISLDHIVGEDGLSLLERLKEEGLSLEGQVEERYLKKEIQNAIERLSDKEQEIIKSLFYGEKAAKDMAKKMKISTGHFYRLQRKAIRRIRGMLSGLMQEMKGA
ncbi:sigma-70 family RNA polymerase sigma factor [Anoxybacter fermentans]|nr:sigma-70 family RNA polymerase sigma factor [Anoxybacter fermentans]